MKRFALSAVVLLFVTGAPALAQQSDRSLTAWIDTLEIDYCQEGRSFDSLGVWVATSTGGDTTVGFQLRDSVLSVTMLLRWDTSTITLTPPYLRIPVQTLLGRFPNRTQFVDTTAGELYITVAADERLRPVIGEGLPLMYLTGRVKVDGELRMPRGGLGIELIEFEGKIDDSLDSKRTLFGFVQVVRDTTPEDPGHLRVEDLNLDTNSRGQVATVVHNVSNRGISTVEVVLAIDTAYARFASVDLEQGWPSLNWEEARLDVRDDTISARFRSDSTITVLDSLLLSIEIDRKSDSAFTTPIDVVRFEVDPFPCGYGVGTDSGTILQQSFRMIRTQQARKSPMGSFH